MVLQCFPQRRLDRAILNRGEGRCYKKRISGENNGMRLDSVLALSPHWLSKCILECAELVLANNGGTTYSDMQVKLIQNFFIRFLCPVLFFP